MRLFSRELKILRQRRQRKRHSKIQLLVCVTLSRLFQFLSHEKMLASCPGTKLLWTMLKQRKIWYISLPSSAKQPREMIKFRVYSRTWVYGDKFFFRFLCFNIVHSNLGPGQLASIFHVKQIGIIAKELHKREVVFWNDVFVAVAVVESYRLIICLPLCYGVVFHPRVCVARVASIDSSLAVIRRSQKTSKCGKNNSDTLAYRFLVLITFWRHLSTPS